MATANKILAAALMLLAVAVHADSYENKPKGWVWYDDSVPPAPSKKEEKKPKASEGASMSAKETLQKMGEEYEEAEARAILYATDKNIRDAMEKKIAIMQMTQLYADRYEQVTWRNPELDYTLQSPQKMEAVWASDAAEYANQDAGLKKAASNWAIVYVFRSDCPYCKRFAPILKTFAEKYGYTILSVTLDGRGSSDFPNPKTDVSVLRSKNMVPQVVPAVYLVEPRSNTTQTIGFGVMNMGELRQRIGLAAGIEVGFKGVSVAKGVTP